MRRRAALLRAGRSAGAPVMLPPTHDDARLGHRRARRRCSRSSASGAASSSARWRSPASPPGRCSARASGRCCCPSGSRSPYAPLFALVGALLAGALLASGLERLGARLRRGLPLPGLGVLDGALGALLSAALALGVAWLAGAVVLQTPALRRPAPRRPALGDAARRSTTCCRRRGRSSTRSRASTRCRRSAAPARTSPRPRARCCAGPACAPRRRAWCACSGPRAGSGSRAPAGSPAPGLVVTNAHVVAGEQDTVVQLGGTGAEPATPRSHASTCATTSRCCASAGSTRRRWRSPATRRPAPAARSSASRSTARSTSSPRRIGATRTVISEDAYGRGPVRRGDDAAARARAQRQLRRARGRRRRPRADDRLRRHDAAARRGGFGVAERRRRGAPLAAARARGTVSSGPCAR